MGWQIDPSESGLDKARCHETQGTTRIAARTCSRGAPSLEFGGLRVEFSGPDEVTEVGRRYTHNPGDRGLGDLLLQKNPGEKV